MEKVNQNNINQLIELQYFGCIDYFKIIGSSTYNEIEQWENFQKMSYRNRCTIFGSNGPIDLSVPLKGGREQKQLMKEIKIDNISNWRSQHIRAIKSSYAKSPFFEYYFSEISRLIGNQHKFLLDQNMEILSWLCETLKISTTIKLTEQYHHHPDGIPDLRNKIKPQNQKFLSTDWAPKYLQVFEDKHSFQPNLSIIDLLFCEGPNSKNLLLSSF